VAGSSDGVNELAFYRRWEFSAITLSATDNSK